MGIAQAGIAFKSNKKIENVRSLVSTLCGEKANQIEHPNHGQFDIRRHTDVMVQIFRDSCFICNNDLVWNFLENPRSDLGHIYRALGKPESFLLFCHYDSGGSYGYSFVEHGVITRSRLQTTGVPRLPPIIEFGNPKDIEKRWLSASFYIEDDECPMEERRKIFYQGNREIEVSEYHLTKRILDEILLNKFNACPWETDQEPVYHFFRLNGKEKPWWQLW